MHTALRQAAAVNTHNATKDGSTTLTESGLACTAAKTSQAD